MEPSAGLGGWAAIKLILAFGLPAVFAAILGMLIMPPRSAREFLTRTVCTVFSSLIFGPVLAILLLSWRPSLADYALWMAQRAGVGNEGLLAMLYMVGPCMLIAGLPAWWVLAAYMRWMASMRQKGLLSWLDELCGRGRRPGGER